MDLFFFLIPTFIAYRMGARGVWLFAIFMFSWVAFVIWLIARKPALFAKREQQREAAELERTLMIVRAMNPALADEIAEQKTYERVAPLMATRPAIHPAWPHSKPPPTPRHQTIFVIFAVVLALTALAMAPQIAGTPPPTAADAQAKAKSNAEFGEAQTSAKYAVKLLRGALRDPDSLVVEEAFYRPSPDDVSVCINYRARNGFGGFNRARVVFVGGPDRLDESSGAWEGHCVGTVKEIPTWIVQ